MSVQFLLSEYIERALARAEYDKLEDGTFSGRIAACPGVAAFGVTLRECEDQLRSTLEEWVRLGLKLGHKLPVIEPENKAEDAQKIEAAAESVFERRKSTYEELAKGAD